MLKNAYLLAKIGADTAENEHHFAEILPIGRRVTGASASRSVPGRGPRSRPRRGEQRRGCEPAQQTAEPQGLLSVVDDNQKVVGALAVVETMLRTKIQSLRNFENQ